MAEVEITERLENKSIDDLYEIKKRLLVLIRDKEREQERMARGQFVIGDRISFKRTQRGEIIHGTVQGFNNFTLRVKKMDSDVLWVVPPSRCHKVTNNLSL